ncbi:metal-sensing transcriptional repressor [Georgenia daeguensis]|uniref:Uncharacterized protein n=1 Tax=Georgenia daeguensis TaxID=908355 RepID=A0ABP8EPD2_9MICO
MDMWLDLHELRARDLVGEAENARRLREIGQRERARPRAHGSRPGARLEDIEGQVRRIRRMVRRGEERAVVLREISAVVSALDGLAVDVLEEHLRH